MVTVGAVSTGVLLCGSGEAVESLADVLAEEPVTLRRAGDAVSVLEHLETSDVDCVVAPGRVGDLDLEHLVRELRSRGYASPIVGLADGADLVGVLGADVDEVVPAQDPETGARGVLDVLARDRLEAAKTARRRLREAVADAEAAMAVADSRGAVEAALVETLVERANYRSGWVGRYDADDGAVTPAVAAGLPLAHLADRPRRGATATAVEGHGVGVEAEGTERTLVVPLGEAPESVLYLNTERPGEVPEVERDILADLGIAAGEALSRVVGQVSEAAEAEPGETVADARSRVDTDGLSVLGDALAHELSNQVDVAMTHLGLAGDREDAAEHVAHVEDALERMSALADDAQALARGDVDSQPCALEEVAAAAWARIDVGDSTLEAEPGRVWADEQQLTLMLENLFRNAVEHGRPEGEDGVGVRIGPRDDGGFVVADDGVGIPEAEREAVLEWGYSGTEGGGVGLGIVRLVAERHDWTIDVGESDEGGVAITVG